MSVGQLYVTLKTAQKMFRKFQMKLDFLNGQNLTRDYFQKNVNLEGKTQKFLETSFFLAFPKNLIIKCFFFSFKNAV